MIKLRMNVTALAIGLAFSAGAMAQTMSNDQYRSGIDRIAAEYKTARAACGSLSGNASDICKAEASGNEKVAKAELDARHKPSSNAAYKVNVTRAEANYSVAIQKCDDKAGNVKDVCVKEAKAAEVAAKSDAKATLEIATANDEAARTSARASTRANEANAVSRRDAAADKRDADYTVAKEKCDAFASDAKTNCLNEAKARFGRS